MDRLRRDIRDVFSRQQEGLGDLGGVRERVLRGAVARRGEPIASRAQFMAGVAAVVLTTLIVATFAYGRAGSNIHPYPPASSTRTNLPASPTPLTPKPSSGLHRVSIDLLEGGKAWALLSNCVVASKTCNYFVAATTDGGLTWSTPVQVGASYEGTNGDAPRVIRFLNLNDGFVYGGGGGFMTHDGGKTWTGLGFEAVFVNSIIGSGQAAWAFTYPCPKATVCSYEARMSRDGGRTWSAGQPLPASFMPVDEVLFALGNAGTSELLVSNQSGDMLITSSGGKRFRSVPSQCKDNPFRSWVTTTDGNELWVLCAGFPATSSRDFSPKALYVSEDGGLTWSQNAITQAGVNLPTAGMQAAIVSTKPHLLLLEVDPNPILMTTDSGASWTQVAPSPTEGVFRFRFFNQTTGWAMGTLGGIWWTTDGGLSWTRLSSYDAA